ncbi:MAG: hypothetical protein A2756_05485 [Candidatus Ryanbacteria bacterium RIFCSPHIGHO2_01_FULL_48_27]|uniref:Uncharacterized protein n=1 Tax=Candidatus Ryanbacteria bacterium RIFCSPHIGHO2_01_FULL_48_27 TaxID=1802115 RepID=A0A1G2G2L5_9BACT|nr:MAG: hypothetical protein A2756_05485 [Candidatus Ryanbacteria bacterium RIFCSPHIGHO2_01_FULL_48_27]
MTKPRTTVKNILKRICSACGAKMQILTFNNRTYTGGHFFGKVPLFRKSEWSKSLKAGVRKQRMGSMMVNVLKKDPKPYKFAENWECERCYQRGWILEKKYPNHRA